MTAAGIRAMIGGTKPLSIRRAAAAVLTAAAVVLLALHGPAVARSVRSALAHSGGVHPLWLAVAAAAEILSLASLTLVQRQLLAAGGTRLPWPTMFGVVLASTGLARLMPAGPVTGGAWQIAEYRRRGAVGALSLWAVLAGGFASTVALLGLLLAGAAAGGTSPTVVASATALVAACAASAVAAAHRADAVSGWLSRWRGRRRHGLRRFRRLPAAMTGLSQQRAGFWRGTSVLAFSVMGAVADAGVLVAAFGLAGLAIPWRGLLFAYATGQMTGRLVPLPGGLGGVEGGVIGGLALTGTPPAAAAVAALIYRAAGYWAVGAAGTATAALTHRRSPAEVSRALSSASPTYARATPGHTSPDA
jgi:putative heme transporter